MEAMSPGITRADRRWASAAVPACLRISTRRRAAKKANIRPERTIVVLKATLEKPGKVPRRLKCRCHHSGSDVVRTAISSPVTSTAAAADSACAALTVRSCDRRLSREEARTG